MNREEYVHMDRKLDAQTKMLIEIKDDINTEVSVLKLAHQRLKYAITIIGCVTLLQLTIEYPKLVKFVKELM